jgi:hypothetical protein
MKSSFVGIFALYDNLRKVNNNILDQIEEVKKLCEELAKLCYGGHLNET